MVSVDKLDVACYQAQAAAANYNYLDPLATKIPIPLILAYQYPFFWYFLYHSFGASLLIPLALSYPILVSWFILIP